MLVTDCCGSFPDSQAFAQYMGHGICPECKQKCRYITQLKFDEENFDQCEGCHGEGEVERNFPGNEGEPEFDAPVECFECGGAGMIKKLSQATGGD